MIERLVKARRGERTSSQDNPVGHWLQTIFREKGYLAVQVPEIFGFSVGNILNPEKGSRGRRLISPWLLSRLFEKAPEALKLTEDEKDSLYSVMRLEIDRIINAGKFPRTDLSGQLLGRFRKEFDYPIHTPTEAARILGISRDTLQNLYRSKRLSFPSVLLKDEDIGRLWPWAIEIKEAVRVASKSARHIRRG